MQPIAYVRSPYRQKFAVPRQPNLVREAVGDICFVPPFADPNMLRGIDGFSHVWLIFRFHQTADEGWAATVTPPRLGGTERVGVLASRSPYRPNPLGLSVVEIVGVMQHGAELRLRVRGLDLVDGTPIYDVKPYVPYADSMPDARGGYATTAPAVDEASRIGVAFSDTATQQLANLAFSLCDLRSLITEVLQQDPRPAQHIRNHEQRDYGMHLYDYNVRWRVSNAVAEVLSIEQVDDGALPWKP
jgi:tRNA-Thr(GGU) m(6)t(6)A37 methyltransferase TsaA